MDEVTVKIVNTSGLPLPAYSTIMSAGLDVRACLPDGPVTIAPMERLLIPTGLRVALPEGYEMQLRPRSGLALKHGISLVNTPGTVDADYRGEIGVILINLSSEPFSVSHGDRICQMVVSRYSRVAWDVCDSVEATGRGDGGFGHTGVG